VLLAEELLLLGLDPEHGTVVNAARQQLLVGLAGALVSELALGGAVALDGRRFVARGPAPADPLLARVHAELAGGGGRRAADQLRRLDRRSGGLWPQLVDRLADEGVLGRRRDRVLLWHVTRHPVLRPLEHRALLRRLRTAATGDGGLDARTAVLLALAGPSRLLEVVAPDRADRPHAKRRIAAATDLSPVALVVKEVIAAAQTAAGVAVMVATTSASS
jgi:hypothetical protein